MRKKSDFVKTLLTYFFIVSIVVGLGVGVFYTPDDNALFVGVPVTKSENGVMLTFNVYQGTEEVERIIDILLDYNVKATFL